MKEKDHYPRKSASITARSSSFLLEDLQNLSLYIKNLNDNLNNIDNQLSKTIVNKSLINSEEIINESEDDDDYIQLNKQHNPFSRNTNPIAVKRYSTHLFNTAFKEKVFKQGFINNTSIIEDSVRDEKTNQLAISMTITHPLPDTDTDKMNMTIPIKTELNTINTTTNTIPNSTKNIKASPKNISKTRATKKSIGLTERSLKDIMSINKTSNITNFEKYSSERKILKFDKNKDGKTKELGTTFTYGNHNHKLSQAPLHVQAVHPKKSFFPFELISPKKKTIPSTSINQSKGQIVFPKKTTVNNTINDKKYKTVQVKKTMLLSKKELIDYKGLVKTYNDKSFAEVFLLFSEMNLLSNAAFPSFNSNETQSDYYKLIKNYYLTKNNDSNKIIPIVEESLIEDKTIYSIRIQRLWRKWHINKLIKSTLPLVFPQNDLIEQDIINKSKLLFYHQFMKKDKNFKEMILLMQKLNESYHNCLNNKYFEEYKTMILNDFKIKNKKGNANKYSNIINLNLKLKKTSSLLRHTNSLVLNSTNKTMHPTKKIIKHK